MMMAVIGDEATLIDDLEALLDVLQTRGFLFGVAFNSRWIWFERVLESMGLLENLSYVVTSDQVAYVKPLPFQCHHVEEATVKDPLVTRLLTMRLPLRSMFTAFREIRT